MRVPLSWLREYVDLPEPPREIAERLTFAGVEVEGMETVGGTFEGIVVGEVRAVDRHPNADKLTICRVFDGKDEVQVVCGAPNVRAGGKYPFATLGARLPKGDFTIKKAKLRGVESFGMLCAEDELGLSEDHSGLMTLEAAWAAGTPLAEVLGPPDTVFELEITPNRPDLLSLIGLARELGAIFGRPVRLPGAAFAESGESVSAAAAVAVEDPEGCPRYTARAIVGVTLGPSPRWMQERLARAGVRPISNVVDITNYVMLECGQPLHAFDHARIEGRRIVVRRAREGDRLATLDGIDRPLTPDTLLICDGARPVALAGVMGGAGSEIADSTRAVLLESACFKPPVIRATSKRLGLSTESSYRFERGVDIGTVEWASRRAAALMAELAGGAVAPGVIDIYPAPRPPRTIRCRHARVRALCGLEAEAGEIEAVFVRLGLACAPAGTDAVEVTVPTSRPDLIAEVDLIEEFARIHGLDKIPTLPPQARIDAGEGDMSRAWERLREALVGLGLREIMNYSLTSEALLNRFDPSDVSRRAVLPRPISADQSILRPSLIPQLVDSLGRNRARQIDRAAFFELGRAFFRDATGRIGEAPRLALGLMGPAGRSGLDLRKTVEDDEMVLWVKGVWEELTRTMRAGPYTLEPVARPFFAPGRSVEIRQDTAVLGCLGLLADPMAAEYRFSGPVGVLEADALWLLGGLGARSAFRDIPAYPSVSRDVAMIVGEDVRHEDILRVIRGAAPAELESVELFDVFTGEAIGPGRKSLAYSLIYRSSSRTLTDEEANGYHARVKAALRDTLGVEVREG